MKWLWERFVDMLFQIRGSEQTRTETLIKPQSCNELQGPWKGFAQAMAVNISSRSTMSYALAIIFKAIWKGSIYKLHNLMFLLWKVNFVCL